LPGCRRSSLRHRPPVVLLSGVLLKVGARCEGGERHVKRDRESAKAGVLESDAGSLLLANERLSNGWILVRQALWCDLPYGGEGRKAEV
jgi:hypothetical protein